MRAAGFTGDISGIDGVDNWGAIVNKTDSNREEFVYNINDVKLNAALRYRNYKLVKNKAGSPGVFVCVCVCVCVCGCVCVCVCVCV